MSQDRGTGLATDIVPNKSICAKCPRLVPQTFIDGCGYRHSSTEILKSVVNTMNSDFHVPSNCDFLHEHKNPKLF